MKDIDMLVQVFLRATNMIDRLDQLIYSKRLRELELFSFKVKSPTVLYYPGDWVYRKWSQTQRGKKKKSNKFKKFLLDIRKKISSNPVQELDADGTCAMSVSRHSLLDTIWVIWLGFKVSSPLSGRLDQSWDPKVASDLHFIWFCNETPSGVFYSRQLTRERGTHLGPSFLLNDF